MPLDDSQEQESPPESARSSQLEADGSAPSKGARRSAELHAKLAAVAQMDAERLRGEWRRWYRALPPSRLGRELLLLGAQPDVRRPDRRNQPRRVDRILLGVSHLTGAVVREVGSAEHTRPQAA